MCSNYVEGIQFVLYYYYKGVPSWEWYYKFYYAPLCDDIFSMVLSVVQSLTEGEKPIIFNPTQPYPPFK
jgi:5'-3' exoribonuclease 1